MEMYMKKTAALLLSLCMLLTFACALAEASPAANEINWSDVEPQITEAGWQGDFVTFDEIAVKLWVPAAMPAVELTDDNRAMGLIGCFATQDGSASVGVQYTDIAGMSLEDFAAKLTETGAADAATGIINGLPVLTYALPADDSACVALTTESGYLFQVIFAPMSDEGFSSVASIMMASLQAEE